MRTEQENSVVQDHSSAVIDRQATSLSDSTSALDLCGTLLGGAIEENNLRALEDNPNYITIVNFYETGFLRNLAAKAGAGELSEDIANIAFIKAATKIDTFKGGNIHGWTQRVVKNAFLDVKKMEARRPVVQFTSEEKKDQAMNSIPSEEKAPEDIALSHQANDTLAFALNLLSDNHRTAVIMVHLQGIDYSDAAEKLGIPLGTVKSRVSRGIENLRKILQDQEWLIE